MESYERTSFHQSCRGNGDGMQAKWTIRNTGSPSGDRSADQLAARERKAGPTGMAEGLVVLRKPGSCEKTHPAKRRSAALIFIPGVQRSGSPRVPAYSFARAIAGARQSRIHCCKLKVKHTHNISTRTLLKPRT